MSFDDNGFTVDVRFEGSDALILNLDSKCTVPDVVSG